MCSIGIKTMRLAALMVLLCWSLAASSAPIDDIPEENKSPSAAIINNYLQATQSHQDVLRGASMEVDITASVPRLKENGRLRALRKISRVGQVTYHVLSFQGDNTVKNQVIARYLQAEQQGQGDEKLTISPANYKFKYKGRKDVDGRDAYVFQLSPRKKRVGLFKGELCLDPTTYLPIREKGRLVKNPSIFFKKVEFERDFAIQNGIAVPQRLNSTIDVRFIGKVQLNINYSNFEQNAATDSDEMKSALVPGLAK